MDRVRWYRCWQSSRHASSCPPAARTPAPPDHSGGWAACPPYRRCLRGLPFAWRQCQAACLGSLRARHVPLFPSARGGQKGGGACMCDQAPAWPTSICHACSLWRRAGEPASAQRRHKTARWWRGGAAHPSSPRATPCPGSGGNLPPLALRPPPVLVVLRSTFAGAPALDSCLRPTQARPCRQPTATTPKIPYLVSILAMFVRALRPAVVPSRLDLGPEVKASHCVIAILCHLSVILNLMTRRQSNHANPFPLTSKVQLALCPEPRHYER